MKVLNYKHLPVSVIDYINIIFKNTSLEDMMEKNVYKFNYKEETFFAPLWHSEIEFETLFDLCMVL